MAKKKRRPKGEGSLRKTDSGKWRAVAPPDAAGSRASKTFSKHADAQAWLNQQIGQQRDGVFSAPATMTVEGWLRQWLENNEAEWAKRTYGNYRSIINNVLVPYIGHLKLSKLSPLAIVSMLAKLETASKKREAHTVLSSALASAVKLKMLRENPVTSVDRPKAERKKINAFTAEETKRLLRAAESHRLYALFVLAVTTGMRQGELFGLPWDAVDLEAGRLEVRQQVIMIPNGKPRRQLAPVKTESSNREILLTETAVRSLRHHQELNRLQGFADSEMVFVNTLGRLLDAAAFFKSPWSSTLKRAGLKYRNFHSLRHTYATLALTNGVPLHLVSAVLGHAKPSITLDLYSHVLKGTQEISRDTMQGLLFPDLSLEP